MSSAALFLAGALVAAVVGLIVLWVFHAITQRRRRRETPFDQQMQALAFNPSRVSRDQPSGIVTLDPIDEET